MFRKDLEVEMVSTLLQNITYLPQEDLVVSKPFFIKFHYIC